jgi:PAS domain-containing protein
LGQGHIKNPGLEIELQQILDFTPQLVAVFGPDRERIYRNRAAREYLGISLEEWRTGRQGSEIIRTT